MKPTIIHRSRICIFVCLALALAALGANAKDRQTAGYFDRLGRPVAAATNAKADAGLALAADSLDADTGWFRVRFIGDTSAADRGFFDRALGPQRRAVVIQVLTDLSRLFARPAGADLIPIEARSFADPNSTIGALASAVYKAFPIAVSGMVDGALWHTLVTGADPYIGFSDAPGYYAFIDINFAQQFNLDPDAMDFSGVDLYSVVLHEMLHALGIGSFIDAGGVSRTNNQALGYYQRYDTFLYAADPNDTVPLLRREGGCYDIRFHPALGPQHLTRDCAAESGSVIFKTPELALPVYAPRTFEPGASLSHLNQNCALGSDYVIHASIATGQAKRTPHPDEITLLCALGYRTNGLYGYPEHPARFREYDPCGSSPVAGVNDTLALTIESGGEVRVTLADLIANDLNATAAVCFEVIGGARVAQLSHTSLIDPGDTLRVTPNPVHRGEIIMRYLPVNAADTGNITYVFIKTERLPVPACIPDGCNYVCNGGFEIATKSGHIPDCSDCCKNSPFVQSWWSTSSDIYRRSSDPSIFSVPGAEFPWFKFSWDQHAPDTWDRDILNTHYAGFWTVRNSGRDQFGGEDLFQELAAPLLPDGSLYVMELYVYPVIQSYSPFLSTRDRDSVILNLDYSTQIFLSSENPCATGTIGVPLNPDFQVLPTENHSMHTWTKVVIGPFTVKDTMSWLTLRGDPSVLADSVCIYAMVDDIVIRNAGIGITSSVSNQNPVPGEEITYSFEICNDIPANLTGLTLIDSLPNGLEYIGGDFMPVGEVVIAVLDPTAFDTAGCATLTLRARVADDARILGVPLTNRIYLDGGEDCYTGLGKTAITVVPAAPQVRIERSVSAPICRNAEFTVSLNVCNTTFEPMESLTITEMLGPGLELVDRSGVINGVPDRPRPFTNKRYTQLGNTLNFTPLFAQAASPAAGDGLNCIEISYRARIVSDAAIVSLHTRAHNGGTAPVVTEVIELRVLDLPPAVDLGPDTTVCGVPWRLDAGSGAVRYLWSTGAATQTIDVAATGDYWVEIHNEVGCGVRDTITVTVEPNPVIQLLPSATSVEPGDMLEFRLSIADTTGIQRRSRPFECVIRYDRRIFRGAWSECAGDECILNISGEFNLDNGDLFSVSIPFRVIGSAVLQTSVSLESFRWLDCAQPAPTAGSVLSFGNSLPGAERLPEMDGDFTLAPNQPNPFSERTRIEFELRRSGYVRLTVRDIAGRLITTLVQGQAAKGRYAAEWITGNASSGVYLLTLTNDTDNFGTSIATRVILLLR